MWSSPDEVDGALSRGRLVNRFPAGREPSRPDGTSGTRSGDARRRARRLNLDPGAFTPSCASRNES